MRGACQPSIARIAGFFDVGRRVPPPVAAVGAADRVAGARARYDGKMRGPLLSLCALALASCTASSQAGPPWARYAAQADEAGLFIASETALLVVPGNLTPRLTPEQTARDAAMVAWVPFNPNDCVVPTVHGATVTYALDGCMGSFGLVHVTGHLAITYVASTENRTEYDAATDDLVLNGGAVSFRAHASVLYDSAMGMRTIDVRFDQNEGVGPSGTAFSRTGTQTGRWFDSWGCLFVDHGQDHFVPGGDAAASFDQTTTGLSFCVGECPEVGGTITWTGAPGTLHVGYDGSRNPTWSVEDQGGASVGAAGSLSISCGI